MDCPICQTTDIEEGQKVCPTCGYDISPYPLSLVEIPHILISKEQQRIAWARELWTQFQAQIAQTQVKIALTDDELDQRVKEIEQLTENQSQLSAPLSESIPPSVAAKFSELEQRLEAIESQLPGFSAIPTSPQSPVGAIPPCSPSISTSSPNIDLPLETFSFEVVQVNSQGEITSRENHQAQYFTEQLGNSGVTLDMVYIPGGEFIMGSSYTKPGKQFQTKPEHRVTVPSFLMGKYPVTQVQWEALMVDNPSKFQGANRPVEQAFWESAGVFCHKLSQMTGRYYRLPSEAEWEYACRAGTTTQFYFGETITSDLANCTGKKTTDVGSFPPNAFGLYDMHGNVWEWCADYPHENYEGAPTDGSAWTLGGSHLVRIVRGGAWDSDMASCGSAFRYSDHLKYAGGRRGFPGFRVVFSCASVCWP
jgi:formylglycine-generating enzyme required for sulfatase activity